ncbi:MAG: type II toxin-antitoxin system RelB/DinJ family antitoxin [Opitutaceae bacterium]|jgi:addiction module RelB/DinJ family antitoxin
MATIQLRTRIERSLKRKSDALLARLGLDAASYVSMALTQLVNCRGIPFAVTDTAGDYFEKEYGLNSTETVHAGNTMRQESTRARRAGRLKEIKSPDDLKP